MPPTRIAYLRLPLLVTILVWILTPAQALNSHRSILEFGHTKWTINDGSFASITYTIAQTADGYVWFGTQTGLLRYDGVRCIKDPDINDRLPSSIIASLAAARDGSLWIGTNNGLSHLMNHRLINYPNLNGWINSILEDREGKIWFTFAEDENIHAGKLCFLVDERATCYGRAEGVLIKGGYGLTEDESGGLWSTNYDGVARWKSGSFTTYKVEGKLSTLGISGVSAIAPTSVGPLWVGVGTAGPGLGLQQLHGSEWKAFVTSGFDSSTLRVVCLLQDREGALWIGTEAGGLYRFRGRHVDRFRKADGLSSDGVIKIFEDREGNIWVSTLAGIDCFHELLVTTVHLIPNGTSSSDEIDGVLASRDGTVWVARPGSLDAINEERIRSIRTRKSLPGTQVTSLLEDRKGRLWVGLDQGLWVYKNHTFRPVQRADQRSLGGLVTGLAEDVDDSIWAEVSGTPRTLVHIRGLQVSEEYPASKLPAARQLAADPKDGIWLGLMSGDLARYRHGRLEVFSYPHPSGHHEIRQLTVSSEGMAIGATEAGVVAWKEGKRQTLTIQNGLPCKNVFGQVLDSRASLWLSTECGLVEITSTELQRWWRDPGARLRTRVLSTLDGVRPGYAIFNAAARTPDGRLWFVQYSALQTLDPLAKTTNRIAPPVHIEELRADQKSYSTQQLIRLPALTRNLEIDYTGLSFVVPQKVRFRYKLENHDVDWQDPGTRREAYYSDLAPGQYTFRVIACNNDGLWNEKGAALDFSIAPAWYQTNWFRLASVACTALLLWGLYFLRLGQLAREFDRRMEASVAERMRIARELHDTLLQSLHGVMFRFQAARNMLPRRPDEAVKALDEAIQRTEQAVAESRDTIKDLRATFPAEHNLAESITVMGEELSNTYEPNRDQSEFSVTVEGQTRSLSLAIRHEVLRIAHEILTNAFRHANAHHIEAEIRFDRHALRLRFRDDGIGIDSEVLRAGRRPGHWGLPGIRERTQRIGGKLDFWSEAGAGTEVQLVIPAPLAYARSRERSWWRLSQRGKHR
jgi:signal transduction histidine kinase/ligand-binding sensor domain-containing protein